MTAHDRRLGGAAKELLKGPHLARHPVAEADPRRLGRRLVVFTPSAAEIDRLVDRARQELPGLGPNEVVHRVVSHNPDSFWAFARRDRFRTDDHAAEGFTSFLFLTEEGMTRLAKGTFDGTNPDPALLCGQHEKPAGIYVWCTLAHGTLIGGFVLALQKISTPLYRDADLYSRGTTVEGGRALEGLGFTLSAKFRDIDAPHLYWYRRSPIAPQELPLYDQYTPSNSETDIAVTVARTLEDIMRVMTVRSAVYMGEQHCPYDEEFDGNDFSATHLIGYVGHQPAACLRVRYFAQFAKLERLAVRAEFRSRGLAAQIIKAGIELCRAKGYGLIYGHSEKNLVGWYGQFGFEVAPSARRLAFSDHDFVEIKLHTRPHARPITTDSDPYVIIRPEGRWHQTGVLEKSVARSMPPAA